MNNAQIHQKALEMIDEEFIDLLRIAEENPNSHMTTYHQGLVKGYVRCLSRLEAISLKEYFNVHDCVNYVPEVIFFLKQKKL